MAFVISFGTIIVGWAAHQRAMNVLVVSSKAFLFANALLLFTISFIPFPTAVLAEYVTTPDANIAVMFYCAAWTLWSAAVNIWWQSMLRPQHLLNPSLPSALLRKYSILLAWSLVAFVLATGIAYWFPTIALIIIVVETVVRGVMSAISEEEKAFLDDVSGLQRQ